LEVALLMREPSALKGNGMKLKVCCLEAVSDCLVSAVRDRL